MLGFQALPMRSSLPISNGDAVLPLQMKYPHRLVRQKGDLQHLEYNPLVFTYTDSTFLTLLHIWPMICARAHTKNICTLTCSLQATGRYVHHFILGK
jgi:hypothetical protein